jgi:hypothetical protein
LVASVITTLTARLEPAGDLHHAAGRDAGLDRAGLVAVVGADDHRRAPAVAADGLERHLDGVVDAAR